MAQPVLSLLLVLLVACWGAIAAAPTHGFVADTVVEPPAAHTIRERGGVGKRARVQPLVNRLWVALHPPTGLALRQQNLDVLEATLMAVSDPASPVYGQHLTLEEVAAIVQPRPQHLDVVAAFLDTHATQWHFTTACNDYAVATMDTAVVQQLFNATLVPMRHHAAPPSSPPLLRSWAPYTMPTALAAAVRAVDWLVLAPAVDTPVAVQRAATRARTGVGGSGEPGDTITPPVIHNLYAVPNTTTSASKANQALAEFEQAYFYPKDLSRFQSEYGYAPNPIARIVGKNDPNSGYLGEASLDVEYITTVAPGVPTWVFSLDQFDLVAWAQNITATPGAPKVHSVSWGSAESGFDNNTLTSASAEFMKLGTMGFTVLVASGDQGTDHSGLFSCGKFQPGFPASSPYVVSVGGTYLTGTTESGWSHSGGGFSDVFTRLKFQDDAVQKYFTTAGSSLPPSSYWGRTGRAIPDVSALSTNFEVLIQGEPGPISGTSAATPTFAAMISYINGVRAASGKSPLGFLAPALFANEDAFTDITVGNNKSPPCSTGFPATTGWDAVTGLGTPVYPKLVAALA